MTKKKRKGPTPKKKIDPKLVTCDGCGVTQQNRLSLGRWWHRPEPLLPHYAGDWDTLDVLRMCVCGSQTAVYAQP